MKEERKVVVLRESLSNTDNDQRTVIPKKINIFVVFFCRMVTEINELVVWQRSTNI